MARSPAEPAPPALFSLVGEPVRWSLLQHLASSDRRVAELVTLTGRPQNLVSYHLAELRRAGLVSGRRSAADGRDTYYRVHLARFDDLLGGAAAALDGSLAIGRRTYEPPSPAARRPRVLYLCTGNSARSQVAEALTIHRSAGAVDARSAGSHPKPLHPNAVRALAERGIDISGARSKHLDTVRRARFDRVVTLCDKVREVCPDLPGPPRAAHWSMADPAASAPDADASYPAFVAAVEDIDERVQRLLFDLARSPQEEPHAHR